MNTKALPLLVLTFTLIACASGVSGTPAPATPPPATTDPATPTPTVPPAGDEPLLDRRQFVSINVTDGGVLHPLVPGTVIRITFSDGQLSASAGCNTMGGSYSVVGGKLIFHGGGMTEMGCDPARHAQDDWLFAVLGSEPNIAVNGDNLVLTSAAIQISMLDREVAEPDLPLVGATWTLNSIVTGDAASSVPAGVTATITFNADGSVSISPGCNSVGGRYAIDGDELTFSDLITTDMACQGAAGAVEAAVMSILTADVINFGVQSNSLTLAAQGNGLVLTGTNASDT